MVRFLVTGFGPFGDVKENPSAQLAAAVAERRTDVARVWTGLEVSVARVEEWANQEVDACGWGEEVEVVILSLGVASSRTCLSLESGALNTAHFRIPDQQGCQPQMQPIRPEDGPPSLRLTARLPTQLLVSQLLARGFPVQISHDAGEFLCNFLYYLSLNIERDCRDQNIWALFVHVPPFEVVPQHVQEECIHALMDNIVQHISGL